MFQDNSLASGLSEKDIGVQASMFFHVAGPEALQVYNTLMTKPNNKNKVDEKFDQYCNPHKNVMWERHKFTCNQQPGETIDQYVTTHVKTKAQTSKFAKLKDGLICN